MTEKLIKMKGYTDLKLVKFHELMEKVADENEHQLERWGVQTHSAFEWLTYITEELGELAQAISEVEYRDGQETWVVNEAIQVATLSLKIAEMFEAVEK